MLLLKMQMQVTIYEIPNHDYEVIDLEHRDRNKEDVVTSFNMTKCSAYEHPAVQS